MAEGEIELADETADAEGEQLLAQSDDLLCWERRSHLRTVGTVVWNKRAVGLMPSCRAECTRRKR